MATKDPFGILGLSSTASRDEILDARRRLAKSAHPDSGGSTEAMVEINSAVTAALALVGRSATRRPTARQARGASAWARRDRRFGPEVYRDHPSFVVEALPAVAFEAVLVAVSALGDVTDSDPPYHLVADLADPIRCFCQLEMVPEAASSAVTLSIARAPGSPPVALEVVRDALIAELNALDWSEFQ